MIVLVLRSSAFSHNTRTAKNNADIMRTPSKSPMPTSDDEVAANNSGSDTPPSAASTPPSPSLSVHNRDVIAEMDDTEDVRLLAGNNVQHDSDGNVPEMTIDCDIESNDNPPSYELAHSLSIRTNDPPDLATVDSNTIANRRPKRTIKLRLRTDQAVISDNDCANSDCEDPKASGEMIMCAGLGCQSKVGLVSSSGVAL